MKRAASTAYLVLAVLGAVLPWAFFLGFSAAGGTAAGFVPALFVNGAAGGFTADLLVSSVAFWVFLFTDARRRRVGRPWLYVAVNLFVGLSCALPLYLWRRARITEERSSPAASATVAMFLALLLAPTSAVAGQAAAPEPEAVVTRFYQAYRAADVDAMLAVYAPAAVFVDVAQRHHIVGEGALREFLTRLAGVHLAMDVEIERRVVTGNTVVVDLAYVGTLSGAALHQATGLEGCTDTMVFALGGRTLSWYTTIASFGAPLDATLQEAVIESLLPADEATQSFVHQLAAAATGAPSVGGVHSGAKAL
jgi:ketosteroid isomerase-like protein